MRQLDAQGYEYVPRIERFLLQPIAAYNATDTVEIQMGTGSCFQLPNTKSSSARARFRLPEDFRDDLTVKAVAFAGASGDVYCSLDLHLGKLGEGYSTHASNQSNSAVAIAASTQTVLRTNSPLAEEAGDFVTCEFFRDATNAADTCEASLFFVGFLVEYRAG